MSATFDLYQQAFTLSMMANWDSGSSNKGQTVQQLENDLTAKIIAAFGSSQMQGLIGSWQLVWGPVVYQAENSEVADNVMYVAQGADDNQKPVYIVAIAGTNPVSTDDDSEDLDVGTLAPLPNNANGEAIISLGTFNGVTNLEGMSYPSQGSSQTLVEYLNGLGTTGGTLIFTGHSLGGALSPALAVDLVNYGGLETGNFTNVYVYPTAGPTPGTSDFAAQFEETFPLTPTDSNTYQSWNGLVWNSLDIVPHAWAEETLEEIPALYESNLPYSECIAVIVGLARIKVLDKGYGQIQNSGAMAGTFNGSLPSTGNPTCDFLQQAYYQHILAYFALLGVNTLLSTGFFNPAPFPSELCGTITQKYCSL